MRHPCWLAALRGATAYEYRMQARRKAVWITMLLIAALTFAAAGSTPIVRRAGGEGQISHAVSDWSLITQLLMPVAAGILLADRLPRDRRAGADELFAATPAAAGARLAGKYLGATLATVTPIAAIYAIGVLAMAAFYRDPRALPVGVAAFATINLPGLLFVGAFSIACTAVLWPPLYQFLFTGYWFWGNALPPGLRIPSLTGTPLTPIGGYASQGLFGSRDLYANGATAVTAILSIGLLLGAATLALLAAHRYLCWQTARA